MDNTKSPLLAGGGSESRVVRRTWLEVAKTDLYPYAGDLNAFFAVVLDNIANIATMCGILIGFGMDPEFVYSHTIPGAALGVWVGSWALAFLALKGAKSQTNMKSFYTSIPLGLDAPTTIGLPLIVVGPSYLNLRNTLSQADAMDTAWKLGCAVVFMIGVLKLVLALIITKWPHVITDYMHEGGKKGALAGIGFALLGVLQLTSILLEPTSGLISLWMLLILLITRVDKGAFKKLVLTARWMKGFSFPAVLAAALGGGIVYYVMAGAKISVIPLPTDVTVNPVGPHFAYFFPQFVKALTQYAAIAIPYAILVSIGGMTVTSAAREYNDSYSVSGVLLLDATVTLGMSFLGGITQTTPYIGHTAYHREFKARSFYAVLNGFVVGFGGLLGLMAALSAVLPKPIIVPIFVFVAFEICASTFHSDHEGGVQPKEGSIRPWHAAPVIMAMFPSVAQLIEIILSQLFNGVLLNSAMDPDSVVAYINTATNTTGNGNEGIVQTMGVIITLAHGFIATGLLWGSALSYIVDARHNHAAGTMVAAAIMSFFGIIHSVDPNGAVYLPWEIHNAGPYYWFAGYIGVAIVCVLAGFMQMQNMDAPHDEHKESVNNFAA